MTDPHRGTAEPVFSGMIDAHERVTGRVPYTIDVALPGMLEAAVLRSPLPHARVRSVDVAASRRVRGVAAVLTGADLVAWGDVRTHFGPVFRDRPILAIDKVRYVGDPVVAVAAVDRDAAREALDLVEVDYDELPAVLSIDDALADEAPLIHEGPPNVGATFADVIVNAAGGSNICNQFRLRHGDVERGFAEADHVFEDVLTSPAVGHVPLETHAAVAHFAGGGLTIYATTQIPFMVRSQLAEIFGLPASRVRVIVRTLGGGYGAKCYPAIEPIAAVLARATGRPVRLHLSREEEFVTITKHAVRVRMTTGLRSDGTIVARRATCHFNTGAYADIGPRLIKNGGYGTGGPHHVPNVWVDSYAVYTNLPPAGAFRGYGISQAAWAYETQMDLIAERLGMDPLELRMKNLLVDGQAFATGDVMTDAHFRELLGGVAERIGWAAGEGPIRDGSKVRAKGLSCIIKGSITPSTSTATVKLNDDGSVHVLTSSVEMGQGLQSAMAIVAAERLGIPVKRITVSTPDTDLTPYDQQTSSSRSSFAMGGAVERACDGIADQLRELASDALEVGVADLELAGGRVRVKGSPDRSVDYATLVRRARRGNLLADGVFQTEGGLDPETGQGIAAPHWHQAAGAAEVEVDLETGRVE
ncbi:MAG TPA: xanthine dehydrogenase family protein molybdopterin-binding subunit, partial [Candidatus Limnocylindrales bacterium]|nr:xanthine dehydrogenase family protein molybdopterin-binding subunit [Candidatus Limnocylindrales bacterium]